jgi:hypothetical protein
MQNLMDAEILHCWDLLVAALFCNAPDPDQDQPLIFDQIIKISMGWVCVCVCVDVCVDGRSLEAIRGGMFPWRLL